MSSNSPVKAELGHAYWDDRWTKGQTQWRSMERELMPFERNVKALCTAFLDLSEIDSTGDLVDKKFPALLQGATVFVPLCGDTPALSFFAQLGANVVAVELSAQALEKAISDQFSGWNVERSDSNGFKLFTVSKEGSPVSVRLFAGDAFAFFEDAALADVRSAVDIVYDRASLIAIEPALRPRYVAGINGILHGPGFDQPTQCLLTGLPTDAKEIAGTGQVHPRQRRAMFLSAIEREEGETQRTAGPPFHTTEEDVFNAFSTFADSGIGLVVPQNLDADASGPTRSGDAPFVDTYYTILVGPPSKQ